MVSETKITWKSPSTDEETYVSMKFDGSKNVKVIEGRITEVYNDWDGRSTLEFSSCLNQNFDFKSLTIKRGLARGLETLKFTR